MATYEDDHDLPTNSTTTHHPSDPSRYEARPAPRSFDEFLAEVQRIATAVRPDGFGDVDGGGLMVDADLYEEIFGEDGMAGARGASPDFIKGLKHVSEADLRHTLTVSSNHDDSSPSSCPICLLPYAQILTEQEYAIHTDHYVGDVDEMGLRELPCGAATISGDRKVGHVVCGKCVGKWLKVNNTCPLCRSTLDPSIGIVDPSSNTTGANYTDQMLELFRQVFGYGYGRMGDGENGNGEAGGRNTRRSRDFGGSAGVFSVSPGREGMLARMMERDEEFTGMYS